MEIEASLLVVQFFLHPKKLKKKKDLSCLGTIHSRKYNFHLQKLNGAEKKDCWKVLGTFFKKFYFYFLRTVLQILRR
jgi:hypothetical protein